MLKNITIFFVTTKEAQNIAGLKASAIHDLKGFNTGGVMHELCDGMKHRKSSSLKDDERVTLLALCKVI